MAGKLYTWGSANTKTLGNGTSTPDVSVPTQIGTDNTWQVIASDAPTTVDGCVLAINNGRLFAWGTANNGRLGNGVSSGNYFSPIQIGSDNDWSYVSAGNYTSAGIRDGKLYTWGSATNGRLGNGTTTPDVLVPTQIGTDTDWEVVSVSPTTALVAAIKGGRLFTWGVNGASGVLGNGTTTGSTTTPTQIGTDDNWQYVITGSTYALAIKNNGELWAWGSNSKGRTGLGTSSGSTLSPTRVGSLSTWSAVSCGRSANSSTGFGAGICDGKLYTWGSATNGRLGNGTTTPDILVPTQIGTDTDWVSVSCGVAHVLAKKNVGELWTWGNAANGRLGNGTITPDVLVPTQIGSITNWELVDASSSMSAAITAPPAPANTTAPAITGTTSVGEILTVSDGTWTNTPTSYSYKWKKADTSDGSYSDISGATSSTFTLTSDEAGKYLKAEVTATNAGGSTAELSAASSQVLQDPANTALPSITYPDEVLQVGSELTSSPGSWDGVPSVTYAYQWEVSTNGSTSWSNVSGATSSSLTAPSSVGGKYLRLQVVATNSEGSATAYSTATGFISEDPVSVVAPAITGTPALGETLQGDPGTWSGFPEPNFTYNWQRSANGSSNWQTIGGANTDSYVIGENDVDKFLRVLVQGSNAAGEASAASAPVGPVEGGGNATAAIVGALVASGAI
jgi:alpha-tubulin suppressor-like RCC1 family protein